MDVLRPVHPEEHSRVGVHVERALKVIFVQVLETADVEVQQLVRVAQVLVCHLIKVMESHKQRSPLFVPILLVLLKQRVVLDWVNQPDDPLVLCRPKDNFHLNTCVLKSRFSTSVLNWPDSKRFFGLPGRKGSEENEESSTA